MFGEDSDREDSVQQDNSGSASTSFVDESVTFDSEDEAEKKVEPILVTLDYRSRITKEEIWNTHRGQKKAVVCSDEEPFAARNHRRGNALASSSEDEDEIPRRQSLRPKNPLQLRHSSEESATIDEDVSAKMASVIISSFEEMLAMTPGTLSTRAATTAKHLLTLAEQNYETTGAKDHFIQKATYICISFLSFVVDNLEPRTVGRRLVALITDLKCFQEGNHEITDEIMENLKEFATNKASAFDLLIEESESLEVSTASFLSGQGQRGAASKTKCDMRSQNGEFGGELNLEGENLTSNATQLPTAAAKRKRDKRKKKKKGSKHRQEFHNEVSVYETEATDDEHVFLLVSREAENTVYEEITASKDSKAVEQSDEEKKSKNDNGQLNIVETSLDADTAGEQQAELKKKRKKTKKDKDVLVNTEEDIHEHGVEKDVQAVEVKRNRNKKKFKKDSNQLEIVEFGSGGDPASEQQADLMKNTKKPKKDKDMLVNTEEDFHGNVGVEEDVKDVEVKEKQHSNATQHTNATQLPTAAAKRKREKRKKKKKGSKHREEFHNDVSVYEAEATDDEHVFLLVSREAENTVYEEITASKVSKAVEQSDEEKKHKKKKKSEKDNGQLDIVETGLDADTAAEQQAALKKKRKKTKKDKDVQVNTEEDIHEHVGVEKDVEAVEVKRNRNKKKFKKDINQLEIVEFGSGGDPASEQQADLKKNTKKPKKDKDMLVNTEEDFHGNVGVEEDVKDVEVKEKKKKKKSRQESGRPEIAETRSGEDATGEIQADVKKITKNPKKDKQMVENIGNIGPEEDVKVKKMRTKSKRVKEDSIGSQNGNISSVTLQNVENVAEVRKETKEKKKRIMVEEVSGQLSKRRNVECKENDEDGINNGKEDPMPIIVQNTEESVEVREKRMSEENNWESDQDGVTGTSQDQKALAQIKNVEDDNQAILEKKNKKKLKKDKYLAVTTKEMLPAVEELNIPIFSFDDVDQTVEFKKKKKSKEKHVVEAPVSQEGTIVQDNSDIDCNDGIVQVEKATVNKSCDIDLESKKKKKKAKIEKHVILLHSPKLPVPRRSSFRSDVTSTNLTARIQEKNKRVEGKTTHSDNKSKANARAYGKRTVTHAGSEWVVKTEKRHSRRKRRRLQYLIRLKTHSGYFYVQDKEQCTKDVLTTGRVESNAPETSKVESCEEQDSLPSINRPEAIENEPSNEHDPAATFSSQPVFFTQGYPESAEVLSSMEEENLVQLILSHHSICDDADRSAEVHRLSFSVKIPESVEERSETGGLLASSSLTVRRLNEAISDSADKVLLNQVYDVKDVLKQNLDNHSCLEGQSLNQGSNDGSACEYPEVREVLEMKLEADSADAAEKKLDENARLTGDGAVEDSENDVCEASVDEDFDQPYLNLKISDLEGTSKSEMPRKAKAKRASELSIVSSTSDMSVKEETTLLNENQEEFKREIIKCISRVELCIQSHNKRLADLKSSLPSACTKYLEELDKSLTIAEVIDGIHDKVVYLYKDEIKAQQEELEELRAGIEEIKEYGDHEDANKTVANFHRDLANKVPVQIRKRYRAFDSLLESLSNARTLFKLKHPQRILKMTYGDFVASQEHSAKLRTSFLEFLS